ncbi:ABC-type oligopeptide transport system, periplasmic component [Lentilactobacillus senioris DSM 24302 = JCM 17472]|uniref:ABC-type oligopeptide transport system, periplasmic component n=1 Tax=Lentilactobacillus senioris DSM 24302 = JCM 17472 TaxID=1423802 RepID=A0A0R2CX51_9LACO|nr:peptide ABC transporter substrate-binding protein [Lentilactobacillus senioris]KRM94356.1 ABC-type oligopeptide transport system, periplasmic component [Lentilactobacillus senioris DSM 24302 = JCM 17472]
MKSKSAITFGVISIVGTTLLAACGSNSATDTTKAKNKTLNVQTSSSLTTMDVSKSTDIVSAQTLNNTNEGLLKFGTNSSLHKALAKSWTVSNNGTRYTYNLRPSKWSNGDDVTAQDFVYSWQRIVNPKTASQYAYLFDNVKNATKINAGKLSPSQLGVKAVGKYKLVVDLNHAQSYFNQLVANPQFYPQNEKVVKKYGSTYGTTSKAMVYNGPFKLTGWNGTNDTWTMVKNKSYWGAKNVKLNQVKYWTVKDPQTSLSQYQAGKLDLTTLSGSQVQQFTKNKDYVLRNSASTFYLEMNEKKQPLFKNTKARQALSLIANREQFVDKILKDGSLASNSFVPTKMQYRDGKDFAVVSEDKAMTSYNETKAKQLWKEALKESGKSSINLNLLSDDTASGKSTTEYLQSQFEKLPGLKITNQNLPFKTRLARSSAGDFDLVVSAWSADYPDASSFLDLFTTNSSYNNGKWSNAEYDKLVKSASGSLANKPAQRWDAMLKANKLITDQAGVIPLYQQAQPQLVKSNVKGVIYYPTGSNWDYSKAYLTK